MTETILLTIDQPVVKNRHKGYWNIIVGVVIIALFNLFPIIPSGKWNDPNIIRGVTLLSSLLIAWGMFHIIAAYSHKSLQKNQLVINGPFLQMHRHLPWTTLFSQDRVVELAIDKLAVIQVKKKEVLRIEYFSYTELILSDGNQRVPLRLHDFSEEEVKQLVDKLNNLA